MIFAEEFGDYLFFEPVSPSMFDLKSDYSNYEQTLVIIILFEERNYL